MKRLGKIFAVIGIIISLENPAILAREYVSPGYTLSGARIIIGGGRANSQNYSLANLRIASIFGGRAQSANYSLDASQTARTAELPNPPVLNPVTSPTNIATQTLSGTKEAGTSIYINGYASVVLDNNVTWSCQRVLAEGNNDLLVTARNRCGVESLPARVNIILDTIPPVVIIDSPLDGMITYMERLAASGTIDGVEFLQDKELSPGLNNVLVEARDAAGNSSQRSVEVYRVRRPVDAPQLPEAAWV